MAHTAGSPQRLGRSEGRSDSDRFRPEKGRSKNGSDIETRDRLEEIDGAVCPKHLVKSIHVLKSHHPNLHVDYTCVLARIGCLFAALCYGLESLV